jgi:hypothetical protein
MSRRTRVREKSTLPVISDQDMQKSGQDQFAVFCPSTLSRAPAKWHEILGNSNLIKVLFSIAETIKRTNSAVIKA